MARFASPCVLSLTKQREQFGRIAQIALVVVLAGADDAGRHVVPVGRRILEHEVAAEEFADERFKDDVGGEDRFGPILDRRQPFDVLANALPDRILRPGRLVNLALEAVDLLAQLEIVERQVLREAQLVHRVHRDRVVDHVGRRVALRGNEQVHAQAVLGVHPGADVARNDLRPLLVPGGERLLQFGVVDVELDLPDDVGIVPVDGLLPLFVGIAERMPVRGLELRPFLGIAGFAVGERVEPPLREVALRIRLHVDVTSS